MRAATTPTAELSLCMASRISVRPPSDYLLSRDVCSYGYFLLAPSRWDVHRARLGRVFLLSDGPVYAEIEQPNGEGGALRIVLSRALSSNERREFVAQVTRMLRLDEDSTHIAAFHAVDPRWQRLGRGRLYRSPTLFEDVLKTVTSCNVQWPGTISMNRRLCEVLGEHVELGWDGSRVVLGGGGGRSRPPTDARVRLYAFPSPEKIARTRPATLRARCRTGYRDRRIVELARLFASPPSRGGIDQAWMEDPNTPDEDLHEALLELPGVGPYAAANIMQLLGRYARLPLDTESVRHGRSLLGYKGSSAQVMKKVKAHYAPFGQHSFRSYWFEMWEFYESKHGPAHTWDRDTTGAMFTAALLSK